MIADKCNQSIDIYANNTLDPIQSINVTTTSDENDKTIITSNRTQDAPNVRSVHATTNKSMAATARDMFGFGAPNPQYLNAIAIAASQAIADTGATSIFIMEGTPCNNLQPAIRPLTINLTDGTKVKSTHTCDITIPGLPVALVGHVVPKLSIALLIGIRVLCDAGCEIVFTKTNCDVWYKGKIILRGKKDP